jgi:hypothetical protein
MNPAPVVPEDVGPGDEPNAAEDSPEHVEVEEEASQPDEGDKNARGGQKEETIPVTVVPTPPVKTPVRAEPRIPVSFMSVYVDAAEEPICTKSWQRCVDEDVHDEGT